MAGKPIISYYEPIRCRSLDGGELDPYSVRAYVWLTATVNLSGPLRPTKAQARHGLRQVLKLALPRIEAALEQIEEAADE